MTPQFSSNVSQMLASCKDEAFRLMNKDISAGHLLLVMMRDEESKVSHIMRDFGVDLVALKVEIEHHLKNDAQVTTIPEQDIHLSQEVNSILRIAVLEARVMSTDTIEDIHILLAILHDSKNSDAKKILNSFHMNYSDIKDYIDKNDKKFNISDGIGMPEEDDEEFKPDQQSGGKKSSTGMKPNNINSKSPILDNFSTDLTKAAEEGKLDPVVGRDEEILRVIEILCRRKKNNPILIGEPGVGKSAIVEGLASMISNKQTSPILFNRRVLNLDIASVVAGTKYRGQFEERIKAIVKELENNPDIILFIDEIHTMVGAGAAAGSMDAANMLKPALARGTIQCIGATTLDEYKNSIEKDGALERRFQKVLVEPTTIEQTTTILKNIKERYEHHHHVHYSDEVIKACVKLTDRYISDRYFPDKAIDALDETGAKLHLKNAQIPPEISEKEEEIKLVLSKKQQAVKNQNFELAASFRDRQIELESQLERMKSEYINGMNDDYVDAKLSDVEDVVSAMAGIPVQKVTESESMHLKNLAGQLKKDIVAQDKAIEKIVKSILRNRLGLRNPEHPIGAFMFLGPTGVGKTYLAKKMAEYIFGSENALIRIDMSEYSESFNTSRLIGAPPGYVGYEQGGQLTEKVKRHPYSIVLLDEIEKANEKVFNMLLQVLDEGRLTDGNGRLIDFRNTIIVMTSNTGTRQLKEFGKGIGFNAGGFSAASNEKDKEYARSIIQKSLSKQFSPEFLNRLDEIIMFDQLDKSAIKKIVEIELRELKNRLNDMTYNLSISDSAISFIAEKGYDVQFGARPLKRAIQSYIEDDICNLVLNEMLFNGCEIVVDYQIGHERLQFSVK